MLLNFLSFQISPQNKNTLNIHLAITAPVCVTCQIWNCLQNSSYLTIIRLSLLTCKLVIKTLSLLLIQLVNMAWQKLSKHRDLSRKIKTPKAFSTQAPLLKIWYKRMFCNKKVWKSIESSKICGFHFYKIFPVLLLWGTSMHFIIALYVISLSSPFSIYILSVMLDQ